MRFDSYHPGINLLFFALALACAVGFSQPVFLIISFVCPFVYSIKLNGIKALAFNLALVPCIALFAFIYAYYNHFGVTDIAVNFIGNHMTVEAAVTGLVIGTAAAAVIMWLTCMHAVFTSDKVVYIFGKIAPKLALFLSILLRMAPRISARAKKIHTAQKCIGRGMNSGNVFLRIYNFVRIQSIVITWLAESIIETSDSMKSRGFTLPGRTAYSLYRFDNRDRSFVTALCWCMLAVAAGALLDQTRAFYDPRIVINRITPLSGVFYAAYAVFCLLPLIVQAAGEKRFERLRGASLSAPSGR